ncbi:MAG TPA: chemotaxis protein CheA [Bryobacteraceae bacterium]|nr:chemotaxis protein CheA [Bryobacteraceae bacterium]
MMDRFQQAFQEEARELLAELEAALLEMDQNPDAETVGRAFRALHTIKGSGAMFGFDQLAGFAHELETAFDRLRNGQLAVSSPLINLTLAAADQMKSMLEEAVGGTAADPERGRQILVELQRLMGSDGGTGSQTAAVSAPLRSGAEGPPRVWHVRFRPGPEVILHGTNPLLLLGELRELGNIQVKPDLSALPPLAELDPERCYTAWDVVLETGAAEDAIRDVFIFVQDECELQIEAVAGRDGPQPKAVPASRAAAGAASSIRVSAEKVDRLVNLVGELVNVQARLSEISARRDDPEVRAISEQVDRLTAELRENSMSIRMLPLRTTFERFRRLVRDLGVELHKQADLALEGADTELDKTVIDQLNDPLVHLIRNSMDHGIETPEARRAAGKPPVATIRLSACYSGAQVLIRVSDDGRGLDAHAIRARAIERGLIDPAATLSEPDLFSLILAPGFSTAAQVTDVSGRGVGMDVVRRNVEALRGSIDIASKAGEGLSVTLRLPLTLAIIDGLLVRVGPTHFVLPLATSLECVELTRQDIQAAHGHRLASVRGETIPYIRLSEYFEMAVSPPERERIMVVEAEDGHYGLVVDEVLGNHQTVIKNLGRLYRDVPMISGATILGNGTVALILDPHRLVENAIQTAARKQSAFHSFTQKDRNPCYVQ